MRIKILLATMFLLFPLAVLAGKTVRDGSGNLVETWNKRGNRIEIRDKDNNLIRERHKVGDRIEVRDGNGNLIREESGDQD
jgi:YD repeat-containing protein